MRIDLPTDTQLTRLASSTIVHCIANPWMRRRAMNVSQPRIVANRANALQSTGPRTFQGKRRVSLNGLQHGLRANHAALASEDPAE